MYVIKTLGCITQMGLIMSDCTISVINSLNYSLMTVAGEAGDAVGMC